MRRFTFGLLIGVVALFQAGCGMTGKSGTFLKTGYYVAEGDLSTLHYPLIVIKVGQSYTQTYQLSQVMVGGFGKGMGSTSTELEDATTLSESSSGSSTYYMGFITPHPTGIRVRALEARGYIASETEIDPDDVLQDKVMPSVTKEKALEVLRSLITVSGGRSFSASQEETCKGAFEMPCDQVYTATTPTTP